MERLSRFITYPTVLDKQGSYTAIIIDCSEEDTKDLQDWLATISRNPYDIYFYTTEVDDLEWLNSIAGRAEVVLINDTSKVKCSFAVRYGANLANPNPLHYLKQIDVRPIDYTISSASE
jgi:hypothetical protein